MGDFPESVASGSNTFAPKMGSAGAYDSDTLWSAGLANDFSGGVGKSVAENGIYYAEVDTRRAEVVLPPLEHYTQLGEFELSKLDPSPLVNRMHFVEGDNHLFATMGNRLYEWRESTQNFVFRLHMGGFVTSMAYFDGYLHIALSRETTGNVERDYLWIRVDDFSYGFRTNDDPDQPGDQSVKEPYIFHVFGGLLYAAVGNNIYYTAGSGLEDNTVYPPPPWKWEWVGPFQIGSYGETITGIAGLIYQSLAQRMVYVSTQSHLYVLLPGDVPFGITAWPMTDERNGAGMRTFYNRIYIPVGGDLLTLQGNGDMIASGVDNSPYGLPCGRQGDHFDIATSANMPFVTIRSEGQSTIWAGKASAWHFIGKLPVGETVCGSYYTARYGRLFVASLTGAVCHYYLGNTARPSEQDPLYRYAKSGVIDLGWYSGSLYEQTKYWHSAFADAGCLDSECKVELLYLDDQDDGCDICAASNYSEWNRLGYLSATQQEIDLGYQLASKRFRLAARMTTTNPRKTPLVRALGVRYTPRLIDRDRWSITVKIPKGCQFDARGREIDEYDQGAYDTHLAALKKRETPVRFRDLDGKWYWVLVTGASRRIHGVGVGDAGLEYDIDWSFALTEVAADEVQETD